jgi:YesN/AraC family two-component response regulator
VKYATEQDVDVVLLDVRMPDEDGLTAMGHIHLAKPGLSILLISEFDNPVYAARAIAM